MTLDVSGHHARPDRSLPVEKRETPFVFNTGNQYLKLYRSVTPLPVSPGELP